MKLLTVAHWSARTVTWMWLLIACLSAAAAFGVGQLPDQVKRPITPTDIATTDSSWASRAFTLPDSIANQAKQTATNALVLAVLVVSLAATILTCRWFAVVRPRAHWRAVKLWSLWGLAAAAAALLQSNLGPGDITLETGLLSPPIAVLIVITWTWWTAREQRRA